MRRMCYLLSGENETLLWGRDAFLLLDALFDPLNFVVGLDVDLNLFASQGLHLYQHLPLKKKYGKNNLQEIGSK